MKKILLVEDNEAISKGLIYFLKDAYEVYSTKSNKEAIKIINRVKMDLIILDVTLPDGDGFEICKYIKSKSDTPVIFLTAKDEEDDVVLGFDLGAEDYVIKPFRNRELLARIEKILRKYEPNHKMIKCGNVLIDTDAAKVYVNDKEVVFTVLEYKILVLLFKNIDKVVTREVILDQIWDVAGNFVNDNTLTVYIKRIRTKLGSDMIKTVKGLGYRVEKV